MLFIKRNRLFFLVFAFFILFWGLPQDLEAADSSVAKIAQNSPHANCQYCHQGTPSKDSLKPNWTQNCSSCHLSHEFYHPLTSNSQHQAQIPDNMKLPGASGGLSCASCHQFSSCYQNKDFGKNSLRGGPYKTISTFCEQCHSTVKEIRNTFNPHLLPEKYGDACLLCHLPKEKDASDEKLVLKQPIEELCFNCHKGNQHPLSQVHVGLKIGKQANDSTLVLTHDGKMSCVTCHDPHMRNPLQHLYHQIKKDEEKQTPIINEFGNAKLYDHALTPTLRIKTRINELCSRCHFQK